MVMVISGFMMSVFRSLPPDRNPDERRSGGGVPVELELISRMEQRVERSSGGRGAGCGDDADGSSVARLIA